MTLNNVVIIIAMGILVLRWFFRFQSEFQQGMTTGRFLGNGLLLVIEIPLLVLEINLLFLILSLYSGALFENANSGLGAVFFVGYFTLFGTVVLGLFGFALLGILNSSRKWMLHDKIYLVAYLLPIVLLVLFEIR